RRIQAAWDLRIQVSPDHAACRNCRHDPEGNSGESLELERGVKSDDERGGESQKHVNVEPMPRIALFQQPRPALSQGIRKMAKNTNRPRNPSFSPIVPLGRRMACFGEKGRWITSSL